MHTTHQRFDAAFSYAVHFTRGLFDRQHPLLADTLTGHAAPARLLAVVDGGLADANPALLPALGRYVRHHGDRLRLVRAPVVVPGGEAAKNDPNLVTQVHRAIYEEGLCRHSYVLAIGGGAVLDMAGYAAATAHRGIRLVRLPTTVLAQNDAGIGVKNSINAFGVKNFLGTFAPPYAVLNDFDLLDTLDERDWRAGTSEAVKVGLLKDRSFVDFLEAHAAALAVPGRGREAMETLVRRCAELHLAHIATSGDPFEQGASRPLDFGHWAAHKLEQLTGYALRHGEAVAIGIALDATYSCEQGMLASSAWMRILRLMHALGLPTFHPAMLDQLDTPQDRRSVLSGLREFQEHLGGQLTIMLLEDIGRGREVHAIDLDVVRQSIARLHEVSRNELTVNHRAEDAYEQVR